ATAPGDVGDTHLDTRTPGRQRLNHRSVWILAAERADPSRRRQRSDDDLCATVRVEISGRDAQAARVVRSEREERQQSMSGRTANANGRYDAAVTKRSAQSSRSRIGV